MDSETRAQLEPVLDRHDLKLLEKLGSGGFGSVYHVFSRRYQEEFALKVIQKNELSSRETFALTNLRHPNIVTVYDIFEDDSHVFLVLEYCPGGSFEQLYRDGVILQREQLQVHFKDILLALAYCHSHGIAHRDIKPGNILIDRHKRVKLVDFGLAEKCEKGDVCAGFVGSRKFAAPEIKSSRKWDPFAADVWSLGVTFYMMATGTDPWEDDGDSPISQTGDDHTGVYDIPSRLDGDVARFIRSTMEYNPQFRLTVPQLLALPLFAEKSMDFLGIKESKTEKGIRIQRMVTDPAAIQRINRLPILHRRISEEYHTARVGAEPKAFMEHMNPRRSFLVTGAIRHPILLQARPKR